RVVMTDIYTNKNNISELHITLQPREERTIIFAQDANLSLTAEVKSGACLNLFFFNFGGSNIAETANTGKLILADSGASANIYGLYLIDKHQKINNKICVEHKSEKTFSKQLFKGILDDSAQGKFYGHIKVDADAQQVEAKQTNRNLLISPKARFETKPFLEIYADDVKCSHGATIGQLDEEALFYMRQRGLSFDVARQLLMMSFAGEITSQIADLSLRTKLDERIVARLGGEKDVCGDMDCDLNCSSCS
ncbi:MAG: SufD family Fe-S cluster assembly protein, partial [Bacteroidales bacterium]|nr:SufD family Fe-S cluster assembly protein [Bacteroidales bacterium]